VLVGSLPTDYSTTPPTVHAGSLMILDSNGKVVETLSDNQLLDGPWFLAVNDQGSHAQVFVSNVLNGTVTRIDLRIPAGGKPVVESMTRIASGYAHRPDPDALVVGPAGLAYDASRDVLYVASTADNAIYAIPDAAGARRDHGKGQLVVSDKTHLHGPLGLVLAPNGDLIVSNGDAVNQDTKQLNEIVEFTRTGKFVGQYQLDKGAAGAAFGIALSTANGELHFAAVDDNTNTLDVWTFQTPATGVGHHGHRQHEDHGHDSGDDDRDNDN
jgi:DNA-binding beta-propeller fold protein YncE